MNLFNLVAKLTLDDTEYKKGIDRATSSASGVTTAVVASSKKSATAMATVGVAAADVSKRMDGLGMASLSSGIKAAAGWAGVALSIGAVVTALKNAITSTNAWADNIINLGQIYGLTNEQIQEASYLASESGKNAEWALRKAESSGQTYWEVLGLTNEQYKEMIANAHEMGLIVSDELLANVDKFNDAISHLKYQWQAVLGGLLAGDENAEENLQKFFDRVIEFFETYAPVVVNFIVKLAIQVTIALATMAPQLVTQILNVILDTIFNVDWLAVGWNIMKSIAEGIINASIELLGGWLRIFGVEMPKVDFGVGSSSNYIDVGNNYEITERSTQELTIRIESDGVTANDKAVASSLENIIDKKIGEMLGGI